MYNVYPHNLYFLIRAIRRPNIFIEIFLCENNFKPILIFNFCYFMIFLVFQKTVLNILRL